MWFSLAFACVEPTEDDGLVSWSGWVYSGSETTEEARLVAAEMTVRPEPFDPETVRRAQQPYADYAGYWETRVPPETPVTVAISPAEGRRTLWAGDTPGTTGNWFAGALFAVDDTWLYDLFDGLTHDGDAWLAVLEADQVLVLGAPLDDTLGCEDVVVIGEGSLPAAPACWWVDEGGGVARVASGPVSYFAAAVPPGELTVRFGDAEERWLVSPRDVVMAWYLWGGER